MFCQFVNSIFVHSVLIFTIMNNVGGNRTTEEPALKQKIVGGDSIPKEKFPSAVKFYNFGGMCAGTIINSWSVLTAAHCFDHNKEVDDMIVEAGTRYNYDNYGEMYQVMTFTIHENYNTTIPFTCDIALIFVELPIKFGNKSKKALLVNTDKWMSTEEKDIIVAGWGLTKYGGSISEQGLLKTHLAFVPIKKCERLHNLQLTSDMFCLYGEGIRDSCKGDSGGGVLWNGMVIGVVSHGDGCAKKDKPSVYANVWYFRSWIKFHVENFFESVCDFCPSFAVNNDSVSSSVLK